MRQVQREPESRPTRYAPSPPAPPGLPTTRTGSSMSADNPIWELTPAGRPWVRSATHHEVGDDGDRFAAAVGFAEPGQAGDTARIMSSGVDLVDVPRLRLALERSGARFARRVFDHDERPVPGTARPAGTPPRARSSGSRSAGP